MKRGVKYILILSLLIIMTGCSSNEEVINHCSLVSKDVAEGYSLESNYDIYSNNGEVDKVITEEVVTSDNSEVLDYFKNYLNKTYTAQNDTYGGTSNEISQKDNKLISSTTIDYNKMDLKKYVADNTVLNNYVSKNNKLTTEGVLKIYESYGAICQ